MQPQRKEVINDSMTDAHAGISANSQPGKNGSGGAEGRQHSHIVTNHRYHGRRGGNGNIAFLNKRKDEGAEIQPIIEMKAPEFMR